VTGLRRSVEAAGVTRRNDWTVEEVFEVYIQPFHDLVALAQTVHRAAFDVHEVEAAMLLSIKTGGCPEDCAYCPQSSSHSTGLAPRGLLPTADIVAAAARAKSAGATRFCMGAAWRSPSDRQVAAVAEAVRGVGRLGLETCVTLGMLTAGQADVLAAADLDYYNHNLDTSREFYGEIITTRTYDDRLLTLQAVRAAGIKVCCGGIVGMGEAPEDRVGLLAELASLDPHPESVPINLLVQAPGTPLFGIDPLDPLELVRTVATARVLMPMSVVRLSAGRASMSDELQALCFHAGANSIFLGDKLLTTANSSVGDDQRLFARLGARVATQPVGNALATSADGA
jgi:biotin synthase